MVSGAALGDLVARWREHAGGTYQTWFLWGERLKNFRSIGAMARFGQGLRPLEAIARDP
jgi:hypothetical protein